MIKFHSMIQLKKINLKTITSLNLKKALKIKDKDAINRADRNLFGRMLILRERRGKCKSAHVTSQNFVIDAVLHYQLKMDNLDFSLCLMFF